MEKIMLSRSPLIGHLQWLLRTADDNSKMKEHISDYSRSRKVLPSSWLNSIFICSSQNSEIKEDGTSLSNEASKQGLCSSNNLYFMTATMCLQIVSPQWWLRTLFCWSRYLFSSKCLKSRFIPIRIKKITKKCQAHNHK